MVKTYILSFKNISLSLAAYILFYLEDTKFTLPLEHSMRTENVF